LAGYQVRGGTSAGPEGWQLAILIPALILGVAGPFGTTILGWVAVAQIRQSAGRIHGLYLALFDGLLFPLMTLSAVIALAGAAMAKMFVDFYANLSAIDSPHLSFVTRMANWLSLNKEVAVIVGVVAAIAVNVLIVRAVLRAVRKEVVSAPPESSAMGHEIKAASIAIIFALIATALGALAAIRSGGAWPAMALSLLFAGMSIIMALPARRLAVGKSALTIAVLGTVIWPLLAVAVSHGRLLPSVSAQSPSYKPALETPIRYTLLQAIAPTPAVFGSVIERVITHPADGTKNYFLDLDSGSFIAAPGDVFDLLRNRFDKVTKLGRTDEPIKNWAQTSGADLSLAFTSPDVTLALYGGVIVFPTLSFEEADASKVLRMADDASQQRKRDGKARPPLTMFYRHELNLEGAFVFHTREGGVGLLQIVSSTENPRSVKIRYKLVNRGVGNTSPSEAKNGSSHPGASNLLNGTIDGAYVRTGLPVEAMKWPTPPSWGEAKDGLQAGIRVNGDARIGGEVKVELWVCNSGARDVRFRQCGRTDVGLQVVAKDGSGKDHEAEITSMEAHPVFQRIQLPPAHLLKVKEFILRFDVAAKSSQQAQTAGFHLPPGDYKLCARWSDPHPLAANEKANESDWSGELASGEVDVTLAAGLEEAR
jgi:hypothetical protein